MSKRQSKEQKRAAYAWQCVDEAQNSLPEKAVSEYGQLARGLPALIQTNGLGQTLAYLLSKGKYKDAIKEENPHHLLYLHLSKWVTEQLGWGKNDELLVKLIQHSSADYRRATSEAMALLTWLRRFAEARLVKEDGDDDGTS